jgi:hypothetical protein
MYVARARFAMRGPSLSLVQLTLVKHIWDEGAPPAYMCWLTLQLGMVIDDSPEASAIGGAGPAPYFAAAGYWDMPLDYEPGGPACFACLHSCAVLCCAVLCCARQLFLPHPVWPVAAGY